GAAEVSRRLAVAKHAAEDQTGAHEAELLRRATQQQEEFDKAEVSREDRRIQALMESANTAFLADDYPVAEKALNEVLTSQPDNGTAQELLRVVQKARHSASARATRLEYRNEWQDTFDELTQQQVIPNDLITFPDTQAWKTIVERGNKSF